MSFGLKSVVMISALGFSVQLQAAPTAKARPKVRAGTITGTAAPAVRAPVAGSARISVSGPGAMMAVPGAVQVPSAGTSVNAPVAHGGSEFDMTTSADLTAAEAATLRAELSDGVLSELNSAQADLLNAVTDFNSDQEAALDNFVTVTVPGWACGESCARTVVSALEASTTFTNSAVAKGQAVNAGQAFSQGLSQLGILEQAKGACPAELGSLIGG